ncbi:Ribonuclease Z beta-lactamase superfamily hydrolase [Methanonatronarchaeum thermophilum]|uniref:Ribonuclease Z beta-lactamase superfamily hydrolase n=1 Tax=Methanonatronarchaeum thermophilum TaxID=1927129 RepID=A0A1Y3GBL7_9EURY|nr:MBL fold metallo-hydrolase [Methanonatronarchaeum thermophilum]OUJ18861.1 Ribonuclease Z beta-lactamase superfamily hydrolase [Methanonatronarchaeum thermophilum]
MTKTTFLGTGWAVPTKKRSSTSILIQPKNILIDCGGDIAHKLTKKDIPLTEIKDILLTHAHTDHINGLPGLLQASWLSGQKENIKITSTPKAIKKTKKIIKSHEFNFPFEIKYQKITGKGKLDNNVKYTEVKHKDQALAYRYKNITYSGDTKPCQNLNKLAKNTNLLIHEATFPTGQEKQAHQTGHSTIADAIKTAQKTKTKKLAIIHHKPKINIKKQIKQTKKELKAKKINIKIPKDLDTIKTK